MRFTSCPLSHKKGDSMNRISFTVLSVILAFALGCSKEAPQKLSAYDKLPMDAVLLKIGDDGLTKKDFENGVHNRLALFKLANSKAQEKDISQMAKSTAQAAAGTYAKNVLIARTARRWMKAYPKIAEAAIEKAKAEAKAAYDSAIGFDKVVKAVKKDGDADLFFRDFERDCLMAAYIDTVFTNDLKITAQSISNVYEAVALNNAKAAETNNITLKTAGRVLGRIAAGDNFGVLADKYSMDPDKEPGGSLGECTAQDFGGEEKVWAEILKLNEGDCTKLIDAEDSWRIYRLNKKVPADKAIAKVDSLDLSQIYFRRALVMPQYSEKEVRQELQRHRQNAIATSVIDNELPNVTFEYPSGPQIIDFSGVDPFVDRKKELEDKGKDKK